MQYRALQYKDPEAQTRELHTYIPRKVGIHVRHASKWDVSLGKWYCLEYSIQAPNSESDSGLAQLRTTSPPLVVSRTLPTTRPFCPMLLSIHERATPLSENPAPGTNAIKCQGVVSHRHHRIGQTPVRTYTKPIYRVLFLSRGYGLAATTMDRLGKQLPAAGLSIQRGTDACATRGACAWCPSSRAASTLRSHRRRYTSAFRGPKSTNTSATNCPVARVDGRTVLMAPPVLSGQFRSKTEQ